MNPARCTLFYNGRILTGEDLLTPTPRFVTAMLVRDGIITHTGSDSELTSLTSTGTDDTERIDLHGAFTVPGFNDAHLHLGEGARLLREVDLSGAQSLQQMLDRIASATTIAAPGAWLTGGGWDETLWPEQRLPSRYDLDRVTGTHPAVFVRIDVHVSVANSAALALGGITGSTVAPPGSAIDLADRYPTPSLPSGPTGILRERGARQLVEQHIPPATQQQRMHGLRQVLAQALRFGITSVQDNSTDEDFAAIRALYQAGELPLRISEWLPFDAPVSDLLARRDQSPQTHMLRTTMLKAFLDGSLGSRTAALHAPYSDAPSRDGIALYSQDKLTAMARERAAAGFQLGFHAIGDRAFSMALEAFEQAHAVWLQAGHRAQPRSRIEHAQVAPGDAFKRARALGAIASMQPNHLLTDARWVRERLGTERSSRAYAWRSFADAQVPLAFGTDYPVESISPFPGLYAAVTRQSLAGEAPFFPEQTVSMRQALHAYTQGAAHAECTEDWKGLLAPGYVADFAVLDQDLLALEQTPAHILHARVLQTVVGGKILYSRSDQAAQRQHS